ncbi:MAG: hypothetical protein C0505_07415 [Leptothrix sp. (in: Bacteria)]|nr:hypothetical protein [Leptothrix sp. (in: b-proteobacteria)]
MTRRSSFSAPGRPGMRPAADELTLDQQAMLVSALQAQLAASGTGPAQRYDTHISIVLVHGEHAYKIKKALKTAFLDQSTLARRQHACAEELRLNRRLAPELYLGVVAITGTPARPVLEGPGPPLEVAVKMRAFDNAGLWDRLARQHALGPAQIDELAATVASFHDAAARASPAGPRGRPQQVHEMVVTNLGELAALVATAPGRGRPAAAAAVEALKRDEAAAFERLRPLMAQRLADGAVRECHGDLHLGNVVQHGDHALVFDGIEFNDDWRWMDLMNDVAFMAMDLRAHGLAALAHRFTNAWLQQHGDYGGLPLLPYYAAYRAAVRAKVALLRAAQPGAAAAQEARSARRYLALARLAARAAAAPRRPALIITHGPSGSGKTTLTQSLLEAAGAVRIRADVERKRLAGLDALAHSGSALGAGLYSAAMTAATYQRLLDAAAPVVEAGCHAILDATFLQRAQRDAAHRWAAARGLAFVVLDFPAPPALLHQRVRQRLRERAAGGGDASEADAQVLAAQLSGAEALQPDEMASVMIVAPSAEPALPALAPSAWQPLLQRLQRSRAG